MIPQARELLGNYRGLSELVTTSGFSVLTMTVRNLSYLPLDLRAATVPVFLRMDSVSLPDAHEVLCVLHMW